MIAMAGVDLPMRAARAQIASAIGAVVQANRMSDGSRKITSIAEITGIEGETVTMQEIFQFRQTGVGSTGNVLGHFTATGIRSRFSERFATRGIRLPETMFTPTRRAA